MAAIIKQNSRAWKWLKASQGLRKIKHSQKNGRELREIIKDAGNKENNKRKKLEACLRLPLNSNNVTDIAAVPRHPLQQQYNKWWTQT